MCAWLGGCVVYAFLRSAFVAFLMIGLSLTPTQAGSLKDGPAGTHVDWSGVYLGLHAGAGWSTAASEMLEPPGLLTLMDVIGIPTSSSHDLDGFLVGGHLGLQRQFGQIVFGVEASFSGGRLDGSSTTAFDGVIGIPPLAGATWDGETTSTTRIGEIFTATGRLGFAWDRWLTYVKGGYASADVSRSSSTGVEVTACVFFVCGNGSGSGSTSSDARHHGWVVGGGLEYMIGSNVSFGIEYNYIDLGAKTHNGVTTISVDNVGSGSFDSRERVDVDAIHTVYARLSFKVNP
jgi:outer membrane immunogenic protein